MWKKIFAAVLMISVISVTAVLVWSAKSHAVPAKSATQTQAAQSQTKQAVPSQNVRFTIYPEGILPAAATVHSGLISISIEDLANVEGGVLIERMEDTGASRLVGNVRRFEQNWRGRASVDLAPGHYRLRIPSDKAKEAVLTVEP
jgi:hypothetical protein